MGSGIVYVVYNDGIQSPKAKDGCKTYKIGKTEKTVSERYYRLDLKMPGEFVCKFAYKFDNGQHGKVETMLKERLKQTRAKGEWFDLNDNELDEVHSICKEYGGVLDTETIQKQITENDSIPPRYTDVEWAKKSEEQKAAIKAHYTRKDNKQKKREKRSQAAKKAWDTRRKDEKKNN